MGAGEAPLLFTPPLFTPLVCTPLLFTPLVLWAQVKPLYDAQQETEKRTEPAHRVVPCCGPRVCYGCYGPTPWHLAPPHFGSA